MVEVAPESLAAYTSLVGRIVLATLAVAFAYQLLTGGIHLAGVFREAENGPLSPGRIQLALVTLGVVLWVGQSMLDPTDSPSFDLDMLLLLGGSQALYFGDREGALRRFVSGRTTS